MQDSKKYFMELDEKEEADRTMELVEKIDPGKAVFGFWNLGH